jgi:hypothetical protein
MRRWTWLICGGLVLAPVAAVVAGDTTEAYPTCEGEPSPAQRQAAQGAFQAGSGSYQEGEYTKAIEYWRDAYRRDCTAHMLLLNLANAYERLGDRRAAVLALKTYLERQKDVTDRPMLEKRIKNLEEQIAAAEAASAKPSATPPPASSAPSPAPVPTQTAATTGGKSITPWIVVGVGGVLTVVGVLTYAGGKSKVNDAEAACPDRVCADPATQNKGNDGRKQMNVGGVLTGLGLAGVAGGLVWHFAFDKPGTPSTGWLEPTVAPGYAGMSYGGTF